MKKRVGESIWKEEQPHPKQVVLVVGTHHHSQTKPFVSQISFTAFCEWPRLVWREKNSQKLFAVLTTNYRY